MKVGVGYCDDPETTTAGIQAVEKAIRQAGRTDPCDMVLLFSTVQHDPSVLREAAASVVGTSIPIYGGGTVGVITNNYFGYAGNQIGVACIWLDGVRCDVLVENGLDKSEQEAGQRLGQRLSKLELTSDSPVILFYDAVDTTNGLRVLMATWLLEGIHKGLGFLPDLTGVGMIGDFTCASTQQWIGDTIGDSNAIALVFSGDIAVDNVIMHGCRPATQYYTVTKASGPVILEINGQPAIPFMDNLLGSSISPEQYPFFLIFGINHGDRWGKYHEDNYANRLCLGIDKKSNGIVMFEPDMVEGTEFQLMFRSLELDYIKPKIDKVFDRLDGREPVFAMYIDCAGRCAGYAGTDLEDATAVQKAVADRVPILGLYNGVEIAPIGGQSRGLDWTGVFCLFSQSKDDSGLKSAIKAAQPVWNHSGARPQPKEASTESMSKICEQNVAKILALDTTSTAIRLELEQKRRGFALLAELAVSLRQNADHANVFMSVARRVNAALNMQRSVVLEKQADGLFAAVVLQGYSANEKVALAGRHIAVPSELLDSDYPVLVTGADSPDRLKELRELLGLPYFVSAPVILQGEVVAVLIAGRVVEAHPYLIQLGTSDAETVQALSTLLASVLAGQHLMAAEERNQVMVGAMPVPCLFWDDNGNLTDCNQAALSLFEVPNKEEFLERFFSLVPEYQPDGSPSQESRQNILKNVFLSGGARFHWVHMTTAGELFPSDVTLIRVPKGDSYVIAGYIRDLRDQESAAQYAQAKNEFIASISREIRAPLEAIQSMARVAGESKNLNEEQQSLVNQGVRSITLLASAIDTILDFSKLDSGQLLLETVNFAIGDLVKGVREMTYKDAEEKSLYLRTVIESDVPAFVQGDFIRLQQVLFNVVMNAVKFTETGGVDIRILREHNERCSEAPLVFEVRDTGIGIGEEQKADLFKPLYSGSTAARKYGGMGMGLAVSAGLIRLMGGTITCESRLGEGSIFRIHISLPIPKESAASETASHKGPQTEVLRGMRVLVVEDNKVNQMIMQALLSLVSIEVTVAENGIKALEKLREGDFDLVLMDIQMPEMDGLTATAQIRSDPRYKGLPILAMTAHAGAEFVAETASAGMNDHLTKPVDVKRLYSALIHWGKR
jgi:CheY-like chemotaxis protein